MFFYDLKKFFDKNVKSGLKFYLKLNSRRKSQCNFIPSPVDMKQGRSNFLRQDGRYFDEMRQIKIQFRDKEVIFNPDDSNFTMKTEPIEIGQVHNTKQSETVIFSHGLTIISTEITPLEMINSNEKSHFLLQESKQQDRLLKIYTIGKTDFFNLMKLKTSVLKILEQILIKEIEEYQINVTILQYDNRQTGILPCIVNSIVMALILVGIPVKDCAFGTSIVQMDEMTMKCRAKSQIYSQEKDIIVYDPTKNEENNGCTFSADLNFHKKTLNYCELRGKIHHKDFNRLLDSATDCSAKITMKLIEWMRTIASGK
ncbi:hypothetical protein M153_15620001217 [Pseudoloma neurophilia]|uniref:Uncharacterized protein n=1 Tax=Pseudoloma neurophilia TaxID=146866 RepID=A0A0R0LUX6_9MICR|nr:hypothetical protein M153_15620001217 [Pseudoloma neurophilia]